MGLYPMKEESIVDEIQELNGKKNINANGQQSDAGIGSTITHVVKRGETLEKIANQYSVTISEVKKWNRLRSSRIMVGQKLKIQNEGNSVEAMEARKEKRES